MKAQLKMLDLDFDWDREVTTCSPDYYKWTQWIFLKLHEEGLAYKKEAYVNWDPVDKTVLANEQVDSEGKSWRSGAIVEQKKLNQWFFKIRDFAPELLNTSGLDWPDTVKKMQHQWIGESQGTLVDFKVGSETLSVFTTRVDTIFGVTFLAISPDHHLNKSGIKSGDTGLKAVHPLTNKAIPVHVCDFVVSDFAQGAVMGVPAHDARDMTYAKENNLPIIQVIDEHNNLISSGEYTGMSILQASFGIASKLIMTGFGRPMNEYRIRDWLISRQRNWGCPIPIVNCPTCGPVPVQENSLPILHDSPIETLCPCGKGVTCKRETDTMDTFVDSSWYFLRYTDPKNSSKIFDSTLANKWMNVDVYIGGIEHAVLHLLYARFIHKFLHSLCLVTEKEPFKKLITQGIVQGRTFKNKAGKYFKIDEIEQKNNDYYFDEEKLEIVWEKMSKSKGNGVNPEEVIREFGVDVVRLYILFKAPVEKELEWDRDQIVGQQRFLTKLEDLHKKMTLLGNHGEDHMPDGDEVALEEMKDRITKIVIGFSKDMSVYSFNTCISWLHKYLNVLNDHVLQIQTDDWKLYMERFLTLLYPFAPTICKKLSPNVASQAYPEGKASLAPLSKMLKIVIAINGKKKGLMTIPRVHLGDLEQIVRGHPDFSKKVATASRVIQNEKVINFIVENVVDKKN
jgi:leucyl-tRNA synthetase